MQDVCDQDVSHKNANLLHTRADTHAHGYTETEHPALLNISSKNFVTPPVTPEDKQPSQESTAVLVALCGCIHGQQMLRAKCKSSSQRSHPDVQQIWY